LPAYPDQQPIFINGDLVTILMRMSHRVMFDPTRDHMIILCHHKIIRLGTAAGKHHIGGAATGKHCHCTARGFNNQTGIAPKAMNR